ncbi:triple gene block protein 2 [Agapanthus carlavirus B]|uniref:Movement protein TGB2 n=1 Tax=Agapanthus carlavirus B TaxID=2838076 RepID=A0A8E7PDY2_9VIRU|nr:triple gene block protein 2 [Agapanthus carlavirus B]QVY47452.1 triple gene block protein 2 [Agapanthus carlavirus B]
MPLSPPPDNSKSYLVLSVCAGVCLSLFLLTRSTLPHTGDNIHSLPHGGTYQDGTKTIRYCSPNKKVPSSNLFGGGGSINIFILVILLVASIIYLSVNQTRRTCVTCRVSHS